MDDIEKEEIIEEEEEGEVFESGAFDEKGDSLRNGCVPLDEMDTQTFFKTMRKKKKHSANFYSDEHNLRRLRQLKIERKPMDFDKLKKHEESFLANVYIQREEKNKEMKDKLEKLQNSYEVKFKSKKYMEFSDHYMADRNHFTLEKEKNYKLHSSAKTYGKKVTEITNSVRNV